MNQWPDTDQVLSRFRGWLDDTRTEVEFYTEQLLDAERSVEPVGAIQLVERLTAIRHEMKLLTKAARGGEERQEAALLSMQAAIEQFRSAKSDESAAADRAARPLVEGLIDLDESLRRGRCVIENAQRRIRQETSG